MKRREHQRNSDVAVVCHQIFLVEIIVLMCVFQVTVLIYSDLLLFTREDEAGRCNVLQSPLYLNTVQLRQGTTLLFQGHLSHP